jgi:hypothetical protein
VRRLLGSVLGTAASLCLTTALVTALATALVAVPVTPAAAAPAKPRPEVIGTSVRGVPIQAWHVSTAGPHRPTVVLIASMHGDERAVASILTSLRDGRRVRNLDLWVVPNANPDGRAAHRRWNARGVDLNRNYPVHWKRVSGRYHGGRAPASEPETKALMRFLTRIDPDYVLSFHQPLLSVDSTGKNPGFNRRVAAHLGLPLKSLNCNYGCHGTMTQWFNARFKGTALTVEYGARPSARHMSVVAPAQVLRLFNARR